ncbi:MAG: transcriptional regulator MraZ [Fimbriimonadales bacterium]|jgi:MraZ protein|nr:MAG: division/cell wall cluster transcriptional repressor MraZ [Armatimonadetes bacterium CP1_7O]OYT74545.1 MAG: division/cell wall cluster transcriptional repressor MraZ [Armatimonadetes bacterium JP3_11]RMH06217.1 MAG: division/cell wall cluster transcriptional repressor MraZ [Armatimonadota bacterium]GIV04656.1 MAG: transcriptional regulator MraZ [Fimbriimonadales bacterium]
MALFQGGSTIAVDDKGRVIIPMRLRTSLGERFTMTRGFDGCVFVFTTERWNELAQKFEQGATFDPRKIKLQRFLFSAAAEVTTDNQGRVAIPQDLREWANIEPNSEVVIMGCANRVEIWAKHQFDKQMDEALSNGVELMQYASEIGI